VIGRAGRAPDGTDADQAVDHSAGLGALRKSLEVQDLAQSLGTGSLVASER